MAPRDDFSAVLDALEVTAKLTGTEYDKASLKVLLADLSAYSVDHILAALTRCRRELKGRLTIASIVERIPDGRPGPNEAWASIPRDEATTVCWTQETLEAWGIALPLIDAGEIVAARMAFLESYERMVMSARNERRPVKWQLSLGSDLAGRKEVIDDAVRQGRITSAHAQSVLPAPATSNIEFVARLENKADRGSPMPEEVRAQLRSFRLKVVNGGRA